MKISEIFSKYMGREVKVKQVMAKHQPRHKTKPQDYMTYVLDEEDAVVTALKADFQKAGIADVRLLMPGDKGAEEYHPLRINVQIDDVFEGKFTLNRFTRG
jgi:hypothetical protein